MNTPVAVIIPTLGRKQCVLDTLNDLEKQNQSEFEVWLVDQNSPALDLPRFLNFKLFHEKVPPLGSHAGRNHAIFQTKAKYCVFVDDDVRLEKNFLTLHLNILNKSIHSVGAIAGRVIQPKDGFSEAQMKALGSLARYNKTLGLISGNFIGFTSGQVDHIHECNFSAKTEVLKNIGGFNQAFEGNAYFEGADLALRIKDAGFSVEYHPEIVLTHLQDGKGGNRVQNKATHTYWYMRNYGLLNSLHMNKIGLPVFALYGLGYVLGKSIKNADPRIGAEGLRGLAAGMNYFLPFRKRLKTYEFSSNQ